MLPWLTFVILSCERVLEYPLHYSTNTQVYNWLTCLIIFLLQIPISLQTLTAEIDILQQYGKISQAGHKRLLDIIHRIWKKKKNINDNGW